MFKLIIVEDEPLALAAMTKSIDYAALNFDLLAACEDGMEAWEAYQKYKPDLVLTDINMPRMTGLDLAKAIYEDGSDCRVIIITGYDSFDFARQAIAYQVTDYLLKPLTPDELRSTLAKNAEILQQRREEEKSIFDLESEAYHSGTLAKNQILQMFISGALDQDLELRQKEELQSIFSQAYFQIALLNHHVTAIRLTESKLSSQQVNFLLNNLAEELALAYPCITVFPAPDNKPVVLLAAQESSAFHRVLRPFLQHLQDTFTQLTSFHFTAGYSTIVSREALPIALEQASLALEFTVSKHPMLTIAYEEMQRQMQDSLNQSEEAFISVLMSQENNKLLPATDAFITELRFAQLSSQDLQKRFLAFFERLDAMNIRLSGQQNKDVFMAQAYENLSHLSQYPLIFRDFFLTALQHALEQKKDCQIMGSNELAQRAKSYIEQHSAGQISLLHVCKHFAVSMSYFSSVFKAETGQTFVEYLTEMRMQHAKKLLTESNEMLYKIAEMVGYDSAAYFTAAFKKNTGYTPKEYRKNFTFRGQKHA